MFQTPFKKVEQEIEELEHKAVDKFEELEEKAEDAIEDFEEAVMPKKKRLHQKPHFWIFLVFFIVILVGAYVYFTIFMPITNSVDLTRRTQQQFEKVQQDLLTADFVAAKKDIETAKKMLVQLEKNVDKLDSPLIFGYLENQYQAVQSMILSIQEFSDGLFLLTDFAQDVLSQVQRDTNSGVLSIEPHQRKEILEKFSQKTPDLNGAKAQIDLSLLALDQIETSQLNSKLAEYNTELYIKLSLLRDFLDKAVDLSQNLPRLMGLDQQKTYLFLLQNYNELRPTGGFIGTLGIIQVKDGNIVKLETSGVYNFDRFAHDADKIDPPAPIAKYTGVEGWYLRDSNWSPDFVTSAHQVESFYHREAALSKGVIKDYKFDGVIAITPKVIEEFLTIVGAVDVDSFIFNSDNFVDQLQYLVEVGFEDQGVEFFQRKDIIGRLSNKMVDRTQNLNLYSWMEIVQVFFDNLNEKHILIYNKDAMVQNLIHDQNWGGEINQTTNDYLMVVDANLAALKSNQCVSRDISYSFSPAKENDEPRIKAKVAINYTNQCKFTWKSTRYRTYTRVLTPIGSELLKTEGAMDMDRSSKAGSTDISVEGTKTVFGTFIAIEPNQKGTLSFEYYLPKELSNRILDGENYNLYIQKQAGTLADPLTIALNFPDKISYSTPAEPKNMWWNASYNLSTDLKTDVEVNIGFKK